MIQSKTPCNGLFDPRRKSESLLLAFLAVILFSASLAPAFTFGQVQSLFNGTTLEGFEGDTKYWSVQNGAIVGEIAEGTSLNHNTWLVVRDREPADFELHFKFKISGGAGANSGVQIRSQVKNIREVNGYQCDIDTGQTWLGRIYDEHGRALLVERGSRVVIKADGKRRSQAFAPPEQYQVLFREDDWNDYRIVAIGEQIDVYINGTLWAQLLDQEEGQKDLVGSLAFQLHSGGQTRVEFKDIRLETLKAEDRNRLWPLTFDEQEPKPEAAGDLPTPADGSACNFGFELGKLDGWKKTGDAFDGQPVQSDAIANRWPGQTSNKEGQFFIGGFELKGDAGIGTLQSPPFRLSQPYLSFRIGGGSDRSTRVELMGIHADGQEHIIFTATGKNREQMRRVAVDVGQWKDQTAFIRVSDESRGGWGHINFDDVRLHDALPEETQTDSAWRSTFNPVLQHLRRNPVEPAGMDSSRNALETLKKMFVPPGFSVQLVASEPDIHQPIAFTFDAKGRIWVVEGHSYPEKRPEGQGLDRIVILADEDGDGKFETRKVFSEKLNLVSGIAVGHGGVWLGAAPELLFIPDRDGDDIPDRDPVVLLDGFDYSDTHETLNSFLWGPDGWLYGTHGVFNCSLVGKPGADAASRVNLQAGVWRYHPTEHRFEVFATGGSNAWGLDYDQHGQLFMTHCRSYWGKGSTTHVMQGGHYWNQLNADYAPFIVPHDVPGLPHMKNYLLASARYDHGEGGAGKRGTDAVYGGHSHVGTMIYLGDNWPAEYRNHLFTHNLHGHQINQQVNTRQGGGYQTCHAGQDVFFCEDPQFIGVDLQVGPDGAVYISDWYDPRHCHNPNTEAWDRGNGRIYRLQFDANYRPAKVNLHEASDLDLVRFQLHENDWYARQARLVLAQRARQKEIDANAVAELRSALFSNQAARTRLRALWALNAAKSLPQKLLLRLLDDSDEYLVAWAVQLGTEFQASTDFCDELKKVAESTSSRFVRRYLASSIQRIPFRFGWKISEILASRTENAEDRDLPKLLWHGLAPLAQRDWDRSMRFAKATELESIRDYLLWYCAKESDRGHGVLIAEIGLLSLEQQKRHLQLLGLAIGKSRRLTVPPFWSQYATPLYDSSDLQLQKAIRTIGAAYADPILFQKLREELEADSLSDAARLETLDILAADASPENLELFLKHLQRPKFATRALAALRRYDSDLIAQRVIPLLSGWEPATAATGVELLSSRPQWAERLFDGVQQGRVAKSLITAFHVRQMIALGNESLSKRLAEEWGSIRNGSEQLQGEIRKTVNAYSSAPLWAFSAEEGAAHYKRLCASCHVADPSGIEVAPKLEGTSAKGIEYLVENIIDPNAVIGKGYQAHLIMTTDGQVLTGVIQSETTSSITLRTATETITVDKSEIEESRISENSFMPEGLLDPLNERERIELLKFLMGM
jgi:putative membrane-bound dehydrogenase-like protein